MQSINTFTKGMDKDTSKLYRQPTTYFDAQNMHVVTQEGSSNGAIVNAKGNKFEFELDRDKTFNVLLINEGTAFSGAYSANVTISVTNNPAYTVSATWTLPALPTSGGSYYFHDVLDSFENFLDTNAPNFNYLRVGQNSLLIWFDETVVSGVNVDLAINQSDSDLVTVTAGAGTFLISDFATKLNSNPKIIGYANIRNTMVLFSTTDNNDGQIWSVDLSNPSNPSVAPVPELLYNGFCGFSTEFPIEAIGKYENDKIQRVYWTDNNNPPRCFNIINGASVISEPDDLNLEPNVDMVKPVMKQVREGGVLPSGTYQYAYRLRTEDGKQTVWSPLSGVYHVVEATETGAGYFNIQDEDQYVGLQAQAITNKAVDIQISGVDLDYDFMEVVAIYRGDLAGPAVQDPEIYIFEEEPVPRDGEVVISHTGNEEQITLAVSEFILLGVSFDKVKTLTVKDERLLLANGVVNDASSLRMDARAYRFDSTQDTYVTQPSPTAVPTFDPFTTTNETDVNAVNPQQDYTGGAGDYIYQQDGATYGGEGVNVTYSFYKEDIEGDTTHSNLSASLHPAGGSMIAKTRLNTSIDLGDGAVEEQPTHWRDYKNPIYNARLKGYQRGETYRFGLVLYNKQGRPGFVNWIGDIRFPFAEKPDSLNTGIGSHGDFLLSKKDGLNDTGNRQWLYTLGINFDITIPADIRDEVSGFEIVRVKREQRDKTVLGSGIIQNIIERTAVANDIFDDTNNYYILPQVLGNVAVNANHHVLYIPEISMNGFDGFRPGDSIRVYAISEEYPVYKDNTGPLPMPNGCQYWKYYDQSTTFTVRTRDLTDAVFVREAKEATIGTDPRFINYAGSYTGPVSQHERVSVGNRCLFVKHTNAMDLDNIYTNDVVVTSPNHSGSFTAQNPKYYVTYERVIEEQYGGATEADRSQNVYISTGSYIEVPTGTGTYTVPTFQCFGGDTYVTFFGQTTLDKNRGSEMVAAVGETKYGDAGNFSAGGQMVGHIFPAEVTFNNELRFGYHLVNKRTPADQVNTSGNTEYPDSNNTGFPQGLDQWNYYRVYPATESNIQFFIPPPYKTSLSSEYDNRVWASEVKINGEEVDHWTQFKPTTILDVDGIHGPINKLTLLQDNVMFFQDKGYGIIAVNPRAVIQGSDGISLDMGSGGILNDHRYYSTQFGTQHKWSVVATEHAVYWFDRDAKKFFRFSGDGTRPLSDIQGLHGYFNTYFQEVKMSDIPTRENGIIGTYNPEFNEVLMTFHESIVSGTARATKNQFTIAYNELIDAFTSFFSFTPTLYLRQGNKLYSVPASEAHKAYRHDKGNYGEFYGTVYNSLLTLTCAEGPMHTKTFDNVEWYTEVINSGDDEVDSSTITKVRHYNNYQNTDWITLTNDVNLQRRERGWFTNVPRNVVLEGLQNADIFDSNNLNAARKFKERMRDKFLMTDIEFDNSANNKLVLHYWITYFRASKR